MSLGLRRGIIEEIVSPYEYKVRVVNYDSDISDPSKTVTSDLPTATVMSQPGTNVAYNIGDRVIVGFNKDELSDPVIMGSLSTENYPTEDVQIEIPGVELALEEIREAVDDLSESELFTHIKYSNDGGLTLTSLYEYTSTENIIDYSTNVSYITAKEIRIDKDSSVVYWSIIDPDNKNITDDCYVETTLKAYSYDDSTEQLKLEESEVFTETTIEIPLRLKGFDALEIDFRLMESPLSDIWHPVLTTDLNEIGTTSGDYMGICISNDSLAPEDPSLYSWTSFNDTIENMIGSLGNDLEPRVKELEKSMYGKPLSDGTTDTTGIADVLSVTDDRIDLHGLDDRDISFNINKSMYIDNKNNNFVVEELRHSSPSKDKAFVDLYGSNGHLTMFVRNK